MGDGPLPLNLDEGSGDRASPAKVKVSATGQKRPLVAQGSFAVCSIKQVRFSLGQGNSLAGGEANHAPEDSRVHLSSAFPSLPTEALCLVSAVLTVGNPNSKSCHGDAIGDNDARKEAHLLKSSPRLEEVHRGILIKK